MSKHLSDAKSRNCTFDGKAAGQNWRLHRILLLKATLSPRAWAQKNGGTLREIAHNAFQPQEEFTGQRPRLFHVSFLQHFHLFSRTAAPPASSFASSRNLYIRRRLPHLREQILPEPAPHRCGIGFAQYQSWIDNQRGGWKSRFFGVKLEMQRWKRWPRWSPAELTRRAGD